MLGFSQEFDPLVLNCADQCASILAKLASLANSLDPGRLPPFFVRSLSLRINSREKSHLIRFFSFGIGKKKQVINRQFAFYIPSFFFL